MQVEALEILVVDDQEENLEEIEELLEEMGRVVPRARSGACSGLMKPDTLLGENARQIKVSDDQTTPLL